MHQSVISGVYALPTLTLEENVATQIGKAWTKTGTQQVQTGTHQVQVGTDANGQPIYETQPVYVTQDVFGWVPFSELRNQITTSAARHTQEQYFAYDNMNRQILVDGAVSSDVSNVNGNLNYDQGHILSYDLNGNRLSDTHYGRVVTQTPREYVKDESGNVLLDESGQPSYGFDESGNALGATYYEVGMGVVTDTYSYDALNRIATVSNLAPIMDATTGLPTGASSTHLLDTRSYDAAGRLTQSGPGGALNADYVKALTGNDLSASGLDTRVNAYDRAGNLVRTHVSSADGARAYDLVNANAGATSAGPGSDGYIPPDPNDPNTARYATDGMGHQLKWEIQDKDFNQQRYSRTYAKFEDYVETQVNGERSNNTGKLGKTVSTYDVNGHLRSTTEDIWKEAK